MAPTMGPAPLCLSRLSRRRTADDKPSAAKAVARPTEVSQRQIGAWPATPPVRMFLAFPSNVAWSLRTSTRSINRHVHAVRPIPSLACPGLTPESHRAGRYVRSAAHMRATRGNHCVHAGARDIKAPHSWASPVYCIRAEQSRARPSLDRTHARGAGARGRGCPRYNQGVT